MVSSTENLGYLCSSSFFHWFLLEQPLIYVSVYTKLLILLKNACIIYVIYIIFITIHRERKEKGERKYSFTLEKEIFSDFVSV